MNFSNRSKLRSTDETSIKINSPTGFWASLQGSSLSIIAIVAVIGVVVVAMSVIDLARHALVQVPSPSAATTTPIR